MPDTVLTTSTWCEPQDVWAALFADDPGGFWLAPARDGERSWVGRGVPADAAGPRGTTVGGGSDLDAHAGGWVGWVDYESGARDAGAPTAASTQSESWLRIVDVIGFDSRTRTLTVSGPEAEVILRRLETLADSSAAPRSDAGPGESARPLRTARARHTPVAYAAMIESCRARIRAGDAYQLCLTTRFEVEGDVDVRSVVADLGRRVGLGRGGVIRQGERTLVSASPERFLEVRGEIVRTDPIKGTRPRGADAGEDARLAAELRADPKERAENVMIVDLMRNDLSRVCRRGTVGVEGLLRVESHPAVHQLVSTVTGRVRAVTVDELLRSAFPAGSMTGAPKLSAMTILHGIESGPRGIYSGCLGMVTDAGDVSLGMVIRSVVIGPRGASVGAGGGITWHSRSAFEVAEVALKARGPLAALGAALPPDW